MTSSLLRRTATGAVGLALAAGALAVTTAPGAHAVVAPTPSAEAKAAATWIATQLSGGLLEGNGAASSGFGFNLDLGLGLARTGASPSLASTLRGGIDAGLATYVTNHTRAAKTAWYVATAGGDPRSAGATHLDLIAPIESDLNAETGVFLDSEGGPYATAGAYQSWAVLALRGAGSTKTGLATDALVGIQCSPTASTPGAWAYGDCTYGGDVLDTVYALLALAPVQGTSDAIDDAIDAGVSYLASQQAADGSFSTCTVYGGAPDYACELTEADANDTGLAGWAFGSVGATAQAAKAATWIVNHQIVSLPGCGAAKAGNGALMWTAAQYAKGLDDDTLPNAVNATAQALGALAFLPATTPRVTAPTAYVAARSQVKVSVSGLRAGQQACLTGGTAAVKATANGTATVTTPAGTATRTLTLTTVGGTATAQVKVLGAATVKVTAGSKVKRGKKLTVTVRKLAAGERVTVKLGKKKLGTAVASKAGVAKVRGKVAKSAKAGKTKVTVTGQFANRTGKTTVKVTR